MYVDVRNGKERFEMLIVKPFQLIPAPAEALHPSSHWSLNINFKAHLP
jgi:hypothetical protein